MESPDVVFGLRIVQDYTEYPESPTDAYSPEELAAYQAGEVFDVRLEEFDGQRWKTLEGWTNLFGVEADDCVEMLKDKMKNTL